MCDSHTVRHTYLATLALALHTLLSVTNYPLSGDYPSVLALRIPAHCACSYHWPPPAQKMPPKSRLEFLHSCRIVHAVCSSQVHLVGGLPWDDCIIWPQLAWSHQHTLWWRVGPQLSGWTHWWRRQGIDPSAHTVCIQVTTRKISIDKQIGNW